MEIQVRLKATLYTGPVNSRPRQNSAVTVTSEHRAFRDFSPPSPRGCGTATRKWCHSVPGEGAGSGGGGAGGRTYFIPPGAGPKPPEQPAPPALRGHETGQETPSCWHEGLLPVRPRGSGPGPIGDVWFYAANGHTGRTLRPGGGKWASLRAMVLLVETLYDKSVREGRGACGLLFTPRPICTDGHTPSREPPAAGPPPPPPGPLWTRLWFPAGPGEISALPETSPSHV